MPNVRVVRGRQGPVPLAEVHGKLGGVANRGRVAAPEPEPAREVQRRLAALEGTPWIATEKCDTEVQQAAGHRLPQAQRLGKPDARLENPDALVRARSVEQCTLRDQGVGNELDGFDPLRATDGAVGELDRPDRVVAEPVPARELVLDRGERGIVGEVAVRFDGRLEDGDRIRRTPVVDESLPEQRRRASRAGAIAHLLTTRDRIAQQRFRLADVATEDGGVPRSLEQLRDLRGVVGDLDRLDQEPHRLVVTAERAGTRRRGPEGDLRLRRQGPAVGIVRRRAIGREIVRGKGPGQLVLAERFEEPGRSKVARPTVAPGEGAVRDLADERLDERHLAALGRARVDVLDEQFPPRERPGTARPPAFGPVRSRPRARRS